jgi:hypothetical protein
VRRQAVEKEIRRARRERRWRRTRGARHIKQRTARDGQTAREDGGDQRVHVDRAGKTGVA